MNSSGFFGLRLSAAFYFAAAVLAASIGLCAHAGAQTVLDNAALLGQNAVEVQTRFAGLQPVRSPRRLSSGALGTARLPDAVCEGLQFEQTFFFARQKLQQMELVLTDVPPEATTRAQAELLRALRSELGPELASFNAAPLPESASWMSGDADVMLFRSGRPERPSLRIVIRQRELVNADSL